MQAIVLHELGEPESFRLEEVLDPAPGPGEVVVRLRTAALNRRDVWIRRGQYPGIRLPAVLGSDGCGVVESIGESVAGVAPGAEVVINPGLNWGDDETVHGPRFRILGMPDPGTYAEKVCVPAESVYPRPAALPWEECAALPLAGLTAYRAVVARARVQPGDTVLVTGIGGGVATFALQIARRLGARVFVTSGGEEKLERARALGAEGGACYRMGNWPSEIARLCGGSGPDVVIDSAGGETLAQAVRLVRPGGRIVSYGGTAGPVPNLDIARVFWKQLSLLGTTMGSPREFAAMLQLYASGELHPVIDSVYPLAGTAEAHRRMESAEQFGKIVLRLY